jgi:dTDP-4-dehydrorhamnose 3,5-epimerase
MRRKSCFDDVKFVENKVNVDDRGFLFENFSLKFVDSVKNWEDFRVHQQNIVFSKKYAIRGMHRTIPGYNQRKIITCLDGAINDILWDTCTKSSTFGQYRSFALDSVKHATLFIPSCMAHGYQTLSNYSLVSYLLDREYSLSQEISISPLDSKLIDVWKKPYLLSKKDQSAPKLDFFIGLLSS